MGFGEVRLIPVNGRGPEDVLVDTDGRIYTGLDDGRILRISPDGRRIDTIADTCGRPLGLEFHGEGELLVCDANAGLLVVELAGGKVTELAAEALGRRLLFCNNAAVAVDGTIYFTDSSCRFPLAQWREDLIERTGTGRLLRRATDGAIELIADGLQFANGVALAPDESFVAVAETGGYRVRRVGLSEPGESLLIDGLPGFPDNISTGSDGLIWITQASPRVPALEFVQKLPAFLRAGVRRMPRWAQPKPARTVGVLGVGPDGKVVHELSGEIEGFTMLTGVRERAGTLYFGSLVGTSTAVTSLPPVS
ncbi:MAG TPA: SMP-30/gluconolactonase/LRE family protein [Amycolatopsis sp.]|uniref:SMP-30/gluconolactonase/LRE family protein n=1 Tax=Amycolatopsis sp. TaxID=37632 RepID=UPI002B46466D|nr:SMP-30/gluconolactonase/LRE family protein [Amycolatopsis sp.]HKS47388.1 SMP-30/gluconolactonase/LRE family protein [Amycolatopsis sp.]